MGKFLTILGSLLCVAALFVMYSVTCRVMSGTDDIAIYMVLFGWFIFASICGANLYYLKDIFFTKEKE